MENSQSNITSKSFKQNKNQFNQNYNPVSYNQSVKSSQKSEEQDEFLLDDVYDKPYFPLSKEKISDYSMKNDFFNEPKVQRVIQQPFLPTIPAINQLQSIKSQNIKQKILKFDEDLEQLMRLTQKPQQKVSINKVPTQKQERNKKTLSRLSQQLFPKHGSSIFDSNMKSKMKSRRTVSGFGIDFDTKNIDQPQKINEQVAQTKKSQKQINQGQNLNVNRPEEMQIQQSIQNLLNKTLIKEEKKDVYDKQNSNLLINNKQSNQPINDQSQQKSKIQKRLSEVKGQRDRLSMSRQNLMNLVKSMDEQQKKKQIKIENQRRKVTIDMSALIKLISEGENDQQHNKNKEDEKDNKNKLYIQNKDSTSVSNRLQKIKHSVIQPGHVILQDQGQDEFTPMKSFMNSEVKGQFNNQSLFSARFDQKDVKAQSKKEINYDKESFIDFFQNIKDKVMQQRKVVDNLRRQKQQMLKSNRQALSQFRIDSKKLQQIQQQKECIRGKMTQIKTKISSCDYLQYRKVINQFQLKFGIKIHNYQRITKSSCRNNQDEGFFAEFTYENILLRIKRNQRDDGFALKFQPYTTLKNEELFNFKFDYELRIQLYQHFINKKHKKTTTFLTFMVNFIAYCKALTQLELTLEYNIPYYNIQNIQMNQTKLELEFTLSPCNELSYIWKIDLLKLKENQGITIHSVHDNAYIQIPQQLLKWQPNLNKIQNCFNFLDQYSHQFIYKQIDISLRTTSNSGN